MIINTKTPTGALIISTIVLASFAIGARYNGRLTPQSSVKDVVPLTYATKTVNQPFATDELVNTFAQCY